MFFSSPQMSQDTTQLFIYNPHLITPYEIFQAIPRPPHCMHLHKSPSDVISCFFINQCRRTTTSEIINGILIIIHQLIGIQPVIIERPRAGYQLHEVNIFKTNTKTRCFYFILLLNVIRMHDKLISRAPVYKPTQNYSYYQLYEFYECFVLKN